MEKPTAFKYPYASIVAFGILGNILVIISIFRQRRLLKNDYYFLVLHLAICDLGWLVVMFSIYVQHELYNFEKTISKTFCSFNRIRYLFHVAGIYMMLMIAVLRYRATVHPLKPGISRRKLKIVCYLGYILGLIAGYGALVPICFIQRDSLAYKNYSKVDDGFTIIVFYYPPTVVMAVLYYKVYQALGNQNKYLKSLGSNPVAQSTSGSSFTIVNYIKNHRTFLVCVGTVLCYAVGNLPMSVVLILHIVDRDDLLVNHVWFWYLAEVLRAAGSCSANPLVYGILDKKLLKFWRRCSKRRRQDNSEVVDVLSR